MDDFFNKSSSSSFFNKSQAESPLLKMGKNATSSSPLDVSIFNLNVKGPYESLFLVSCENFRRLTADLTNNQSAESFWFDHRNYNDSIGYANNVFVPINIEFPYTTKSGEEKEGLLGVKLNLRIGEINIKDWSFSIHNSSSNNIADFEFSFYYSGTEKFRVDANDTTSETDFRIDDRYKAIAILTQDAECFLAFAENILKTTSIRKNVLNYFLNYYNGLHSASELKVFYEQAPDYVIGEIGKELLWADLVTLLEYDSEGIFSWFKDSSNAMLNIVKSFCRTDLGITYLHKKFDNDQTKVKSIYEHLQGNSYFENQELPNKTIFAALITTLTDLQITQILDADSTDKKHPRDRTGILFNLTKGYRVDSNIARDDESAQTFVLTQQRMYIEQRSYTAYPTGGSSGGASGTYEHSEWRNEMGQIYSLHPMDIVMVKLIGPFGSEITVPLPAIYVKDIAYHEEWGRVMQIIRLAVNILMIVVSAAIIASGAGLLLTTLAWIDLGLATGDITVQAFENELRKTEWGREFLELWDKIYLVGGIVTGAPLLGNLLVNGAKALARIANAEARIQLVGMLKAALMQVKNFPRNLIGKFEIIVDVLERIKIAYKYPELLRLAAKLKKLQKEGVLITKSTVNIEGKVVEKYQLVFKDSVIAEGTTTKEIREAIEPFFGSGGKVLVEVLEEWRGLIKVITKKFNGVNYQILVYESQIHWKVLNNAKFSKFKNRVGVMFGNLEFDFNTFGVKGLGQQWVDEAFEHLQGKFSRIKTEWRKNPNYPDGESLGLKEYKEGLIKFDGDMVKSVKNTRFYETMSERGFKTIDDIWPVNEDNIIVVLKN